MRYNDSVRNRAFSKIWFIGISAVVLAGGFFAWQYLSAPKIQKEEGEILQKITEGAVEQAEIRKRDARRVIDLKQIQTALELYWNDYDNYPAVIYGYMASLVPQYISQMPKDPLTDEPYLYYLCPPQGKHYHLGVKLEDKNSQYLKEDADTPPCGLADFSGDDTIYIYDLSTGYKAIEVLYPNGGEQWKIGEKNGIAWQGGSGIIAGLLLNEKEEIYWVFSAGDPSSSIEWDTKTVSFTASGGSGHLTIPEGKYKMRISDSSGNFDESSGWFFITH